MVCITHGVDKAVQEGAVWQDKEVAPDVFWDRPAAKYLMFPLVFVDCLLQRTAFDVKGVLALANHAGNVMPVTCR